MMEKYKSIGWYWLPQSPIIHARSSFLLFIGWCYWKKTHESGAMQQIFKLLDRRHVNHFSVIGKGSLAILLMLLVGVDHRRGVLDTL